MTTFLSNRDIYTSVVCGIVPQAKGEIVDRDRGLSCGYSYFEQDVKS